MIKWPAWGQSVQNLRCTLRNTQRVDMFVQLLVSQLSTLGAKVACEGFVSFWRWRKIFTMTNTAFILSNPNWNSNPCSKRKSLIAFADRTSLLLSNISRENLLKVNKLHHVQINWLTRFTRRTFHRFKVNKQASWCLQMSMKKYSKQMFWCKIVEGKLSFSFCHLGWNKHWTPYAKH